MNEQPISKKTRLFISFSSKDIPVIREIMSGLQFQDFNFWDYSDELQQIHLTEEIRTRLKKEIDECEYFVAIISKNSTNKNIGKFTLFEVDYAVNTKQLHLENRIITIELENTEKTDYKGPYSKLKGFLHHNLIWNDFIKESIKSYISLIKGICQTTGKLYVPQISPHHRLPFWEKFRNEVVEFAQSNHSHAFLMNVLGEFNEFYKKKRFQYAYEAISYFISSCKYLIPEYKLIYPFIVKAVVEQHLELNQMAKDSYQSALKNEHNNPDALGGLGMVYLNTGNFERAIECFEKAFLTSKGTQRINERLNLIISKISGNQSISFDEKEFVNQLDYLDIVLDDQKETFEKQLIATKQEESVISEQLKERFAEQRIFVLCTKALMYFMEAVKENGWDSNKLLQKAYDIYIGEIKEENLPNAVTVYYFYLTSRYLGKVNSEKIYERAIKKFNGNKTEIKELYGFMAEHYYRENELNNCISIFISHLIPGKPTRKILLNYSRALKKKENMEYKAICKSILDFNLNGYPESPEDYYWNGFANYLLGNLERANYDFERSFKYDVYYSDFQ